MIKIVDATIGFIDRLTDLFVCSSQYEGQIGIYLTVNVNIEIMLRPGTEPTSRRISCPAQPGLHMSDLSLQSKVPTASVTIQSLPTLYVPALCQIFTQRFDSASSYSPIFCLSCSITFNFSSSGTFSSLYDCSSIEHITHSRYWSSCFMSSITSPLLVAIMLICFIFLVWQL